MVRPSFHNNKPKRPSLTFQKPDNKSNHKNDPPPMFSHHASDELLRGHKGALSPTQRKSGNKLNIIDLKEIPTFKSMGGSSSRRSSNHRMNNDESEYIYEEEVIEESEYFEEEVSVQDEQLPPPRETTIRFADMDEMVTVLHINDYTDHEIKKSWFKRDEYTEMSNLARKTVAKAEERMKEIAKSKEKKNGKKIKKQHKVIESRGLEAWSTDGAAATKNIKERAIEAVFYEQCRQWDHNTCDVELIRDVYRAVSMASQKIANDRATSDAAIVQQYIEKEELEQEAKQHKEKGKSVKEKTKALAKKTAKFTGKVTKKTGKLALGTAVATATLDKKMFKETVKSIPKKKKRECEHQIVQTPSQSHQQTANPDNQGDHGKLIPVLVDPDQQARESVANKKKYKLKLLGVAPIPGTQKNYKQDKREKKILQRKKSKNSNLPSWEKGALSSGKY